MSLSKQVKNQINCAGRPVRKNRPLITGLLIVFLALGFLSAAAFGARAAEETPAAEEDPDIRQQLQELKEKVERMEKEAEARKALKVTEKEAREEEAAILQAAGREYSLLRAGLLEMEYKFNYAYHSYDVLSRSEEGSTRLAHHANHNLYNHIVAEVALLDNLTMDADAAFVYKYDKVSEDDSEEVHDLGDSSVGFKYQPFKAGNGWPSPILHLRGTLPASRGDYEINPETELSTGSGLYAASAGFSIYHPFDPVSAFASLNYKHRFEKDDLKQRRGSRILTEVDPGDRISGALGFGYALSYKVSLSLSFSYTYGLNTEYQWQNGSTTDSGDIVYSSLNLSTNWRLSPKQSIIVGVGTGFTDDDPDFTFSLRIPLQFDLS